MGCDIHLYVEQLEAEPGKDPRWVFLPEPEIEMYRNAAGEPAMTNSWYWGRNYTLFGWLADVRNELGYGTSHVKPLDKPRGVPADASKEYREIVDSWDMDGHSRSHFTLRELLGADLEVPVSHRGWVTATEYQRFREFGAPMSWSGRVGGGGIVHVSNSEMDRLIDSGEVKVDLTATPDFLFSDGGRHYTEIRWTSRLSESLSGEWAGLMDKLSKITRDDGQDVRVVFFFDN